MKLINKKCFNGFVWVYVLALVCTFAIVMSESSFAGTKDSLRSKGFQGDALDNVVDGPVPYPNSGLPNDFWVYGDSGVDHSPYQLMITKIQELSKMYPTLAKVVTYGKTVEGRDLVALRIEDTTAKFAKDAVRPSIEISGAIHGNEFLGIEDQLGDYFLKNHDKMPGLTLFLANGGVIYLIPVVNPDGFEHRRRSNTHGVDLNRDFDLLPRNEKRFKEVESLALANYLEADLTANKLRLSLSFDYHCCVPAMITPWSYINSLPTGKDLVSFNQISALETKILGFKTGNPVQTVGYIAEGTTLDYFYSKYGTLGLALEGRYGGEMDALAKHIELWDAIFQEVSVGHWGMFNSISSNQ